MALRVLNAGTYSLLVDHGRLRTRGLGVPIGGAADRAAYALANAMVGDGGRAVALECTLAGPTLESTGWHGGAFFGAHFDLWINDRPIGGNRTFNLEPGDVLTVGQARDGLRAYLAVPGGFETPMCLGARSSWEPVRKNEDLRCAESQLSGRFVEPDGYVLRSDLRILRGAHAGLFPDRDICQNAYCVADESNRMGLRLQGPALGRAAVELVSAPVCPGTIQVVNDGMPIVLGIDAQTIGGYPRLAHVISADLDAIAQLRPGQPVRFRWVDLDEAIHAKRDRERWLREWMTRLQMAAEASKRRLHVDGMEK